MVSKNELRGLARLARLELDEENEQELLTDVPKILEYVQQIESLDVGKVEATIHPLGLINAFRADRAEPSELRNDILDQVPKREGDFLVTPLVIEEE